MRKHDQGEPGSVDSVLDSAVIMPPRIRREPAIMAQVNVSVFPPVPGTIRANMAPKTGSQEIMSAVRVGDVYFCAMVCTPKANAVPRAPVYRTVNTTTQVIWTFPGSNISQAMP